MGVFDVNSGAAICPRLFNKRSYSSRESLAFSPDGTRLAISESNDSGSARCRAALIWDIVSGRLERETGYHDS